MMIRQSRGRYRIGDFLIVRERWHIWRVWWLPEADECKIRPGVPCDGFPTLREARASVEHELAQPLPPPLPQEMIMSEAENPPAFPMAAATAHCGQYGMSLRDWFATHALGMGFDWTNLHQTGGYAEAAQVAYEIADAMLSARHPTQEQG